ncbi:MAG: hypothetical protein VX792_05690 [Candidatus Latescibacterota bacterium]|nr:hypothetical protein [Candidatus Latescibacterota bacterium]
MDHTLKDTDRAALIEQYDETAEQLLQVALSDGHFSGRDGVGWPGGSKPTLEALGQRAQLIATIHEGIPTRREQRLADAHARYEQARPAYHQANRLYLRLQADFCQQGEGDERDFLQLYQEVYLQALGRDDPIELDEGEKALVQLRVARVPLSHAHAVAEKIGASEGENARWQHTYTVEWDDVQRAGSLRQLLTSIAEAVVDFLAAGELLAIRYNTFSNFIWLGISCWKAITDVELALAQSGADTNDELNESVLLGKSMLLQFMQAHLEDPAQIKPREYWYGQEYSYLTRDLIDLSRSIVKEANDLRLGPVDLPPLLGGDIKGRFLEYGDVGKTQELSTWGRRKRLLRWAMLFRRTGKRKMNLLQSNVEEKERLRRAWEQNREWAHESLDIFGIEVDIRIDPLFAPIAEDLALGSGKHKILFLPTHQSVFDHPVMNYVLNDENFMRALGWEEPTPCTILARSQLTAMGSLTVFGRTFTPIGFTPEEVDRMMEEADGHVVMSRSADTGSPTRRFAKLLDERPGVVYPAGTTSSYALQCLPMQHGLFAHLPPDLVLIPLAFRGIHSLWPKCPKGNLHICPGRVEVVVGPPILGQTTLLPRKRALRTQLEPATLFQAVHIADLYNPAPST